MNVSKTTACSNSAIRLAKTTLTALLNTKKAVGFQVGDTVVYTKQATNQVIEYRVDFISTTTATITNLDETITVDKNLLKTKGPLTLFDKLDNSEWAITSFDPHTRVACIEIDNGIIVQTISVTLPTIK